MPEIKTASFSDEDFFLRRKEQNENLLFTSPPAGLSGNPEETIVEFVYHAETVNGKNTVCTFSHCYGSDGKFRRYILDSDYEGGFHYEFPLEDEIKLLRSGGYTPERLQKAPRLFAIIRDALKKDGIAVCAAFFRSVLEE